MPRFFYVCEEVTCLPQIIRAHPITIVAGLWRVRFLVIIPVMRSFLLALGGNLSYWLAGSWMDVLILLAMVGFSTLRARRVKIWWDERLLHIHTGLILQTGTAIPWEKIVSVSAAHAFYLRPFKAVRLRVDTIGSSLREPDFTVLLSPRAATLLAEQHGDNLPCQESFAPSQRSVALQSLLSSNSLAGIVFMATFVSQSSRLLGRALTDEIFGAFEQLSRTLAFGLPPAGAAIAFALLGGWAVSFMLAFGRYKDMRIALEQSWDGGLLKVSSGLLTKQVYSVALSKVCYLDVRQSLITKALGLYSLSIAAPGYAGRRSGVACLVPTQKMPGFQSARERFFPHLAPCPVGITPQRKGALRFLTQPVCLCAGIALLTGLVFWRVPGWGRFVLFVGLMAMVPAIYFLAVRLTDFFTGGVGKQGGAYTLRYSQGFYLHTVVVGEDKIVQARLRQTFFQRRKGRCDLIVHTRAQGRATHRLRSLPLAQAEKMFA